jgi:hypothetical protein
MARRFRNPRSQISAPHNPDAWLPAFASKITTELALNEFSVPYLASERFLWLGKPLTMDEFEAALDLCNNFSPGMDGIKFNIYKALRMRAKELLLGFLMVFFGLA